MYQIEREKERKGKTAARDIFSLALYFTRQYQLYFSTFTTSFSRCCVVRVLFKYIVIWQSVCCSFCVAANWIWKRFAVSHFFLFILLKTHDHTRSNRRTIWVINYIVQLKNFFFFIWFSFHCSHLALYVTLQPKIVNLLANRNEIWIAENEKFMLNLTVDATGHNFYDGVIKYVYKYQRIHSLHKRYFIAITNHLITGTRFQWKKKR